MTTATSKRAIVTVGLGFGDEGKGATVDFLTRQLGAQLVVRYSGGAQAGHNVELPDGRRHTFSQFGSGTFAGAKTWLGPRVIVSPATLGPEAAHLTSLGIGDPHSLLLLHPDALLATNLHASMNRLRELNRGDSRHGSCGLGIGETRSDWLESGTDSIVAADIKDRTVLVSKLRLLRDRKLIEMQKLRHIDSHYASFIYECSPDSEADSIIDSLAQIRQTRKMPDENCVIFEGAQGVLLDEYFGFHPHTTWSTVTDLHATELIEETGDFDNVLRLGITRSYTTRHGAGPFPTGCARWTDAITDPGNPYNDWQGMIKCGPLDLVLLRYALSVNPVDGIVINHLDQLLPNYMLCDRYQDMDFLEVPRTMQEQSALTARLKKCQPKLIELDRSELLDRVDEMTSVVITGDGPTHVDRKLTNKNLVLDDRSTIALTVR